MKDYFRVRVIRLPLMPAQHFQLFADFCVVVYFTVERNPQCAVLIAHRLSCCVGQVDNGQTPMTQPHTAVFCDPNSGAIRPAMQHSITHADYVRGGNGERAVFEC